MNRIPKLHQLHEFLGKESDSLQLYSYSLQRAPYEDKQQTLAKIIAQYESAVGIEGRSGPLADRTVDQLINQASTITHSSFNIGDRLLYDLTILALGDSDSAGYACYRLGQIYSRRESRFRNSTLKRSDLLAAYFFGLALEKGCVHHRSQINYAEACARMGWFDTALHWMPEDAQEYPLARIYLEHRIRFCKEHGISFPETRNGIVVFSETQQAAVFRAVFSATAAKSGNILRQIRAIENGLPQDIADFGKKMDEAEASILAKSKRSRRIWWILFLLLMIGCIPGCLLGNGEGLQGILYKFFIALCTFFDTEQTLTEKCAEVLALSDRCGLLGAAFAAYGILTAIWTVIARFFTRKTYAKLYANIKNRLYQSSGCADAIQAAASLKLLSDAERLTVAGHTYQTPNQMAQAYHETLITKIRPVTLPAVSREEAEAAADADDRPLPDNYGAFLAAMTTFSESAPYALLWSGQDLSIIYSRLKGYRQDLFSEYFLSMFHAAIDQNPGPYLHTQQSTFKSAIFSKEFDETYQEKESSPSSSLSGDNERRSAGENLERLGNLFLSGRSETNEEAVDRALREGRISDFDAGRAKLHGWNPRDLQNDGT